MPKQASGGADRAEVEAALNEAMARTGPDGLDKRSVALPFLDRGMSKSTVYRWIQELLSTGRPGAAAEAAVITAAKERARHNGKSAQAAMDEVLARVPASAPAEAFVVGTGTKIAVIDRLGAILADMDQVVLQSKNPDGTIRNVRSVLLASRETRQCLEAAVKLKDGLRQSRDLDRLVDAIVSEVMLEAPQRAMRIIERIRDILTVHGV